jgi:arginine decarboxylase
LLDLPTRAACEQQFYETCRKVQKLVDDQPFVPEEFEDLQKRLADIYFCNFSLFQSVPDHWAIRHVFPVMPIQRLNERPDRRAVLGDMTCDSDGKIDRFADLRDVKPVLEVHELRENESYVIAIFLVGAYQEILGDLHNLFGDTDTIHVDFDEHGKLKLTDQVPAESVAEVLAYVDYDEDWLLERYDRSLARLVESGSLTREEADEFRDVLVAGLHSQTYLTAHSVKTVREDDLAATEDDESPHEGPPHEGPTHQGPTQHRASPEPLVKPKIEASAEGELPARS